MTFSVPINQAHAISANHRNHFHTNSAKVKHLRVVGKLAAVAAKETYQRAHLTVAIGWPDKRRRDAHNLMPTLKALIDGYVDAGLLPDDDDEHLVGPDLRPYHAGIPGVIQLDFDFKEIA